jgi:hypothetical protein
MAQPGFIFGGNTGMSYDQVQKQRDIANELLRANMNTPQNVGEGLSAIGRALAAKAIDKRTTRADEANRKAYDATKTDIFASLGGFGGAPAGGMGGGGYSGTAAPVTGPTPITFTPETPNPGALDPSIIAAVDRVAPNAPQQMDAGAIGSRLVQDLSRDFNLTPAQAAGVAGNLAHETGGFKHMQEIQPMIPGSRGGYGFAQWTGPRRRAFEAWTAENGLDPNSYEANYGFLAHELKNTPEGAVLGPLSQAQTPDQAAEVFSNQFLRPGIPNIGSRVAFANQFAQGARPQGAAPQPVAGGAPGMPNPAVLMQLAEIQGNPYASESDKAIASLLMNQTVQAMDPMRQLEMQRAQLELQQMQQPQQPETPAELAERQALAAAGGLQPGTPEYQTYMLTGEMPQAAPRPLTPEERRAWNIPETDTTPYAIGSKGIPEPISAGGVTVNNDLGGGKFDDEFAKGDAASLVAVSDAGNAAIRNLGRIDELDRLLAASPTGAGAALAQAAGEFGINTEGLDEIQSAQAIINSLVPEQRQPGSGPMSDADLALFKQSLPRIINQPGGNQTIIQTMRAIAQYDAEGAQIVQQLRAGEIKRAEAFDRLQARKNPLEGFKPPRGEAPAAEPAPAEAGGSLAVGTVEDGWEYIGGDPAQPESWREVK